MIIERLSALDPRQRKLAAIGLVFIVSAVLSIYLVLPQVKSYLAKSASRQALLGIATSGAALPQEIAARTEAITRLSQRLHGDSANLPLRQMESFLIGRLQKISWDHDIELLSVRPGSGENVDDFQEILFSVELEGGYSSLYRWLWAVRQELGFVVIKDYSLDRVGEETRDPALRAKLTIASYRMNQG
ncbi:MAG: hypothetical protein HKM98_09425 [Gammaproteobacteria bacterium]|nr:hypothetical protein [Gammaproteobacteria bacterium]